MPLHTVEKPRGGERAGMTFAIKAIFDNDGERLVETSDDFSKAVKLILEMADQRLTPLSQVPAMRAIELHEGGRCIFAMAVVRR